MSESSEFIRGPKWRTRVAPRTRATAALATAAVVVAIGAIVMWVAILVLQSTGAPGWVAAAPWWLPAGAVTVWTLRRPAPAIATDDDDDSWPGFAIRRLLVGEDEARAVPIRVAVAVVVGGPIGWALLLLGGLVLLGVF